MGETKEGSSQYIPFTPETASTFTEADFSDPEKIKALRLKSIKDVLLINQQHFDEAPEERLSDEKRSYLESILAYLNGEFYLLNARIERGLSADEDNRLRQLSQLIQIVLEQSRRDKKLAKSGKIETVMIDVFERAQSLSLEDWKKEYEASVEEAKKLIKIIFAIKQDLSSIETLLKSVPFNAKDQQVLEAAKKLKLFRSVIRSPNVNLYLEKIEDDRTVFDVASKNGLNASLISKYGQISKYLDEAYLKTFEGLSQKVSDLESVLLKKIAQSTHPELNTLMQVIEEPTPVKRGDLSQQLTDLQVWVSKCEKAVNISSDLIKNRYSMSPERTFYLTENFLNIGNQNLEKRKNILFEFWSQDLKEIYPALTQLEIALPTLESTGTIKDSTTQRDLLIALIEQIKKEFVASNLPSEQRYQVLLNNTLQNTEEWLKKIQSPEKKTITSNPWVGIAEQRGWLKPGEPANTPEAILKVERGLLSTVINTATERFYSNPNNKEQTGFLNFMNWQLQDPPHLLTLTTVIDNHPGGSEQNRIRDQINHIQKIFMGGVNWHEHVVLIDGPHPEVLKHLDHYLFSGEDWRILQELPVLLDMSKSFGDLVFEGLEYYTHWNEKYILPSDHEFDEAEKEADKLLAIANIPSEEILAREYARAEKNNSHIASYHVTLPGIDDRKILLFYGLAERNYQTFRSELRNEIISDIAKKVAETKQKKYGIFPIFDVGEKNFTITLDEKGHKHSVSNRDFWRKKIAIGIGSYEKGMISYDPLTDTVVDAPGQTPRAITELEREIFFEAGKSAELMAFHTYQSNLGSPNDDNATFLAATKPTRLRYTRAYRTRYIGQEGVVNKNMFGSLLPDPFKYMTANLPDATTGAPHGISIRNLIDKQKHPRSDRLKANFEDSGELLRKNYIDLYKYSVSMYEALRVGLQRAIEKFHLDQLGKFLTEGSGNLTKQLSIDKTAIDALTDFWRSTVGYWIDPRLLIDNEEFLTGLYDEDYWTLIPGTTLRTPLFDKGMINLTDEDQVNLYQRIIDSGGVKSKAKTEIQKIILASMLLESLTLLDADKLFPAEEEAIIIAFTGSSIYHIFQSKVGENSVPGFSFTRAEIMGIFAESKKVRRGWGSVFEALINTQSGYL